MKFILTTHRHLPGVRLSLPGQWGNLPFDNVPAAEAHARTVARSAAVDIEHVQARPRAIVIDSLAKRAE